MTSQRANHDLLSRGSRSRGFTLVELLVVMTVIVILTGLITGVGIAVFRNQQVSATRNIVITLDRALDEYIAQTSAIPPYNPADYDEVPGPDAELSSNVYFGVYPASATERAPRRPDTAVFIKQALSVGQVQPILTGLGDRALRPTIGSSNRGSADKARDVTPSVVDTWATDDWAEPWNPIGRSLIYYVHPQNELAQALFGKCANGRPYFLSAGPDTQYGLKDDLPQGPGEPATDFKDRVHAALKDNITSYPTADPITTDDFFNMYR